MNLHKKPRFSSEFFAIFHIFALVRVLKTAATTDKFEFPSKKSAYHMALCDLREIPHFQDEPQVELFEGRKKKNVKIPKLRQTLRWIRLDGMSHH